MITSVVDVIAVMWKESVFSIRHRFSENIGKPEECRKVIRLTVEAVFAIA
jgi:tetrahydromethanopterin S-methyltransferase subunit C